MTRLRKMHKKYQSLKLPLIMFYLLKPVKKYKKSYILKKRK